MAGRVIWFFGPSGAGKKTLIGQMTEDPLHPLRVHLCLGRDIDACEESFTKGKDAARDTLAGVIAGSIGPTTDLLVKGQSRDIWDRHPRRDLPGKVADLRPASRQEVVFVWTDLADLRPRCLNRGQDEMYDWQSHDFGLEL